MLKLIAPTGACNKSIVEKQDKLYQGELTMVSGETAQPAERTIETANQNGSTSAFHDEINSLSRDERLQIVRQLGNEASNKSTPASQDSYIDLTELDYSGGDKRRERFDLYTPNQFESQDDTLAGRIIKTAEEDGDVSAFRMEISELSEEDKVQLVKDLSRGPIPIPPGNTKSLHASGQIDKSTGELVDIDLVIVDRTQGDTSVKRLDLYTPGQKGEQFDRQQEMEDTIRPYQQLFNLMNMKDLRSRYPVGGSALDSQSRRDDNFVAVSNLLSKFTQGHPERDALMKMFEANKMGNSDENFEPVNSLDFATRQTDSKSIPTEVKAMIDSLIKENHARDSKDGFRQIGHNHDKNFWDGTADRKRYADEPYKNQIDSN